jgi:ParB family chromosome partitioning protein
VSNTRQRLGKGLEALFPKSVFMSGKTITNIPISSICPNPFQPRLTFDEAALQQLSDSIKQHGLAQPIVVRRVGEQYELVAGERRFRASKLAGLETIPAIIRDMTDQESLQIALIENLQREDLNAIEEAKGYLRLLNEFNLTHQELSEVFGRSRSAVTNTLRLLQLPEVVQQAIMNNEFSEGHARALLSLETEAQIIQAFEDAKSQSMNVREMERHVSGLKPKKTAKKSGDAFGSEWQNRVQTVSQRLSAPVLLKGKPTRGKIEISYKSAAQLEAVLKVLGEI